MKSNASPCLALIAQSDRLDLSVNGAPTDVVYFNPDASIEHDEISVEGAGDVIISTSDFDEATIAGNEIRIPLLGMVISCFMNVPTVALAVA